jgi:hypothetical protein
VLAAFTAHYGMDGVQTLQAFRASFVCMALITMASAAIFWQLAPEDSRAVPASREQDVPEPG